MAEDPYEMAEQPYPSIFDLTAIPRDELSTRDAILAGAGVAFIENGFEGVTMDLLASSAGVARRTLYNQFPDGKAQLFKAVAQRMWQAFPEMEIATDPEALADPAVGLERIARGIAAFWGPPLAIAFLRLVIAERRRFPDLTAAFFDVGKTQAMTAVHDYIGALAGRGLLEVEDTDLAAQQFLGLVDEPVLWARVMGDASSLSEQEVQAIVTGAVSVFLARYRC